MYVSGVNAGLITLHRPSNCEQDESVTSKTTNNQIHTGDQRILTSKSRS